MAGAADLAAPGGSDARIRSVAIASWKGRSRKAVSDWLNSGQGPQLSSGKVVGVGY